MSGRFIGIVAALVVLALVMAYLAGFFEAKIPPEAVVPPPPDIVGEVVAVEAIMTPVIEHAVGVVRARDETVVSARILATIASVKVRSGDSVRAGELLMVLDSRELEARLAQRQQAVEKASAQLDEAESIHERIKSLSRRGLASPAELDEAETTLRAAQAELARARRAEDEAATALSYGMVSAPFAGRIIDRLADPGDTVVAGAPLLRMYDPNNLRLEADVRESLATTLDRGDNLVARIDALGQEYPVVVDEIVPSADPGSRSFRVKVALPALPKLYPGMFGRLLIQSGQRQGLYIPARAIARFGQLEFVNVLTEQGWLRRYVRTGSAAADGRTEVLSGLQAGEQVLLSAGTASREG